MAIAYIDWYVDGEASQNSVNLFKFKSQDAQLKTISYIRVLIKFKFYISVLSLFTVVTWGQGQCMAPSGEYGSCVPNNECLPRGGIPGGPCAEGYGMCCVCMYKINFPLLKVIVLTRIFSIFKSYAVMWRESKRKWYLLCESESSRCIRGYRQLSTNYYENESRYMSNKVKKENQHQININ